MSELNTREIEEYAYKLLVLARDTIIVRYRFFDRALSKIKPVLKPGIKGFSLDGDTLYYDAVYLVRRYLNDEGIAVRLYMHILLHTVFAHQFKSEVLNKEYWDLACDIAVENVISELDLTAAKLSTDDEVEKILEVLRRDIPKLTADRIYKYFMVAGLSSDAMERYKDAFHIDEHDMWADNKDKTRADELIITKTEWEKLARRVKTDLKTFSKDKHASASLEENIEDGLRTGYNYREILERFMVMGEELTVNPDEFDYIYYTYGLEKYGDMPLIEPLEYKEDNKIKDFAIVIDTSASCRGDQLRRFISKTYDILKNSENIFHEVNIHIIQCDDEVRSDTVIKDDKDIEAWLAKPRILGGGNTDFRPAFDYVDELVAKDYFRNLKGLIYFTDGYGAYPERMPDYEVLFAFLYEDKYRPKCPGWAMHIIMEDILNEY